MRKCTLDAVLTNIQNPVLADFGFFLLFVRGFALLTLIFRTFLLSLGQDILRRLENWACGSFLWLYFKHVLLIFDIYWLHFKTKSIISITHYLANLFRFVTAIWRFALKICLYFFSELLIKISLRSWEYPHSSERRFHQVIFWKTYEQIAGLNTWLLMLHFLLASYQILIPGLTLIDWLIQCK